MRKSVKTKRKNFFTPFLAKNLWPTFTALLRQGTFQLENLRKRSASNQLAILLPTFYFFGFNYCPCAASLSLIQ